MLSNFSRWGRTANFSVVPARLAFRELSARCVTPRSDMTVVCFFVWAPGAETLQQRNRRRPLREALTLHCSRRRARSNAGDEYRKRDGFPESEHRFLLPPQRRSADEIVRAEVRAYIARRTAPQEPRALVAVPTSQLTLYAELVQRFKHPMKKSEMTWLRPLLLAVRKTDAALPSEAPENNESQAVLLQSASEDEESPTQLRALHDLYPCGGIVADIVVPAAHCVTVASTREHTIVQMYTAVSSNNSSNTPLCFEANEQQLQWTIRTMFQGWLAELCNSD